MKIRHIFAFALFLSGPFLSGATWYVLKGDIVIRESANDSATVISRPKFGTSVEAESSPGHAGWLRVKAKDGSTLGYVQSAGLSSDSKLLLAMLRGKAAVQSQNATPNIRPAAESGKLNQFLSGTKTESAKQTAAVAPKADMLFQALASGQIESSHQANAIRRAEEARVAEEQRKANEKIRQQPQIEKEDWKKEFAATKARRQAEWDADQRQKARDDARMEAAGNRMLAQAGMGAVQGLRESEARLNQNWQNLENIRTNSASTPAGSTPLPPTRPRPPSRSNVTASSSSDSASGAVSSAPKAGSSASANTASHKSGTTKPSTSELKSQLFGSAGKTSSTSSSGSSPAASASGAPPDPGPLAYTEAWYKVMPTSPSALRENMSVERNLTIYQFTRGGLPDPFSASNERPYTHLEANQRAGYVLKEMHRPGKASYKSDIVYRRTPEEAIRAWLEYRDKSNQPQFFSEQAMRDAMRKEGYKSFEWINLRPRVAHYLDGRSVPISKP